MMDNPFGPCDAGSQYSGGRAASMPVKSDRGAHVQNFQPREVLAPNSLFSALTGGLLS